MGKLCKRCGSENTNGTNFCTRKCRILFMKSNDKKYKKILARANSLGTGRGAFDACANEQWDA